MKSVSIIALCSSLVACATNPGVQSGPRTPAVASDVQHQRTFAIRGWGALGAGATGPATGGGGSLELSVKDRVAVGVVGGGIRSSSMTLGPSSKSMLAFGGLNVRLAPFRTLSEPGSHWLLSIGTGVGYARHSWQEGDCEVALFGDGPTPLSCNTVGQSSPGAYLGGTFGWLYSFGAFGVTADARFDAVLGSTSTGALTLSVGPRLAL